MIKKMRDSNIELLRILAVMGVIVLHFNGEYGNAFQYVKNGTINSYMLRYLEGLFIPAVNIFILITGYYMCNQFKRGIEKPLYLIIQVMFFGGITYILSVADGTAIFSVSTLVRSVIPCNYYVILYITLYLISPYINLIIEHLHERQVRIFVVMGFVLFSVWPSIIDVLQEISGTQFQGLNTIGLAGDQAGYTIVNFCLLYIIGSYIRKCNIDWSIRKSSCIFCACSIGLLIWSIILPQTAWYYCNPLVIIEAVSCFLLFKKFQFSNKIINEASKAAFTCFLFHGYFVRKVIASEIVSQNIFVLLMYIVAMMVVIYFISWFAYYAYSFIEKYMIKRVIRVFDQIIVNVKV